MITFINDNIHAKLYYTRTIQENPSLEKGNILCGVKLALDFC